MPPVTDPALIAELERKAPPPVGYIPGVPKVREPTPQTGPQAEGDVLANEVRRGALEDRPLDREYKRTQIGNAAFDNEKGLRDQFDKLPSVAGYRTILPQYAAALRAGPNKAGDYDLVVAYSKLLDPPSVVREGEVNTASDTGGIAEKAKGYFSQLQGGQGLTEAQRKQIRLEMRTRGAAWADQYRQARGYYAQLAKSHNIDPFNIIGPDAGEPFVDIEREFLKDMGDRPKEEREVIPITPSSIVDHALGLHDGPLAGLPPPPAPFRGKPEALIPPPGERFTGWEVQRGDDGQPYAVPTFGTLEPATERGRGGPVEGADAVIRGVADIPTLGLADEIAAAGTTIFRGGTMRDNLARERAVDQYDENGHPILRGGGQVVGGFLLPMGEMRTAGQAIGKSAAFGGGYGFGSGEDGFADRAKSAFLGAGAGALTGGAFVGGGKALSAFRNARAREGAVPPLVDPVTSRLNRPLEGVSPAERVRAGAEFGIDMPLGAATDRGGAIIEKGLDVLPASAGTMNDSRRGVSEQVENALSSVSGRYGQGRSLVDAGAAVQQGANNWLGRFDRVVSKVYDAIPISDNARASLTRTRGVLADLTSAFDSNPKLAEALKSAKLEQYADALSSGSLSWKDLKAFRTRIGYEIGEQRFSDGPTKDQLRALYASLSDDMRNTAAAQGPKAIRAFNRANTIYEKGQERIEGALIRILGDDSKNNPEAAARALQTISKSNGGPNIEQLAQIRASLGKDEHWNEVAGSLIHLMGQPANSAGREFSPQTFVQNYADMAEPARNLLFGDRGRAELRGALDRFVAVNQRLAGTNALRNTSNTVPGLTGSGAVGTVVAGVMNPLLGVKVAGAFGVNYAIGRLWTHAPFVRWATGYTRLLAEGANQSAIKGRVTSLRQIAAKNPSLAGAIEAVEHRILSAANDTAEHAAAASQDEKEKRQNR
jgi:hypothetical protein